MRRGRGDDTHKKTAPDAIVKGGKRRVTTLLRPRLAAKGLTECCRTPAL